MLSPNWALDSQLHKHHANTQWVHSTGIHKCEKLTRNANCIPIVHTTPLYAHCARYTTVCPLCTLQRIRSLQPRRKERHTFWRSCWSWLMRETSWREGKCQLKESEWGCRVCVCMCICVCTCACAQCMCVCVHVHAHAYVCVCVCVCVWDSDYLSEKINFLVQNFMLVHSHNPGW